MTLFIFLFMLAWLLSIAMEPAVHRLANRGWRRGLASAVVLFGLIVTTIAFFAIFGKLMADQLGQLVISLPGYADQIAAWVNAHFHTNIDPQINCGYSPFATCRSRSPWNFRSEWEWTGC